MYAFILSQYEEWYKILTLRRQLGLMKNGIEILVQFVGLFNFRKKKKREKAKNMGICHGILARRVIPGKLKKKNVIYDE